MTLFFAIFGALGLFLYGMKVMSEGLQKVSGEGLRALIRNMTRNRLSGIVSGTLMTTLVQSSSATTVMIVSFVNARHHHHVLDRRLPRLQVQPSKNRPALRWHRRGNDLLQAPESARFG